MSHTFRRRLSATALFVLLLGCFGPMSGCQTNPATGRSQFIVLGEDREIALGEDAEPEFRQSYGGPIPDETVTRYVSDIGQRLASLSERRDLPWSFHAVDAAVVNAFALPGGKVFITRGLMEKMENESQLAAVLGHEIGHVTGRHVNDRMAQALGVSLVTTAFGVAAQLSEEDWLRVLGVGAQLGGTVYMLSYSRGQENESDLLGLRYMVEAGYDPNGMVGVMQILADQSSGGIEWLQTHPHPETRLGRIQQTISEKYSHAAGNPQYTVGRKAFRERVLRPLEQLPPASHQGEQSESP